MARSRPANPELLALFLDPEVHDLPSLSRRAGLPLSDLLGRLSDPSFTALLDAVETLQRLRSEFFASRFTLAALSALAAIARTSTDPAEARRAATTILQHTRRPPLSTSHATRARRPAEAPVRAPLRLGLRTARPRAQHPGLRTPPSRFPIPRFPLSRLSMPPLPPSHLV
ncbi:MAG: hypothetical protein H6811_10070 [Phycisphaeraceae bacterium]|nr:hypothetical protein [Phycisphaeraceae bacterium]